jgi:transposase
MGKYGLQTKLSAVEEYCSGQAGLRVVADRHGVDFSSLRQWVASYRVHGLDGLRPKGRSGYSVEFKLAVLQRLQDDNLSYRQAAALFDIRRFDIIGHWKRRYGEDGVKALALGAAGENRIMKKQPDQKSEPQLSDDQRSREQLLDELNYLRMENAYLKKLEALAQAKKQAIQRKKR